MKKIINKIENLIQGTEPSTPLYMSMDSDAWTEVLVTLKEFEEMKNYVEKLRELRAESPRAFVQLLRRGQVGVMAIEFNLTEIPEAERESYKKMALELLGGIGKLADADQREWKNLTEEEIYKIKTDICCKCKYLSGDGHNRGNSNKTCEYIDMENRIRGAFPGIGCLKKGKFKLGISKYRARALRVKHG